MTDSRRKPFTWPRFKEVKKDCKLCCGSQLCDHHAFLVNKYFIFVENKPWVEA